VSTAWRTDAGRGSRNDTDSAGSRYSTWCQAAAGTTIASPGSTTASHAPVSRRNDARSAGAIPSSATVLTYGSASSGTGRRAAECAGSITTYRLRPNTWTITNARPSTSWCSCVTSPAPAMNTADHHPSPGSPVWTYGGDGTRTASAGGVGCSMQTPRPRCSPRRSRSRSPNATGRLGTDEAPRSRVAIGGGPTSNAMPPRVRRALSGSARSRTRRWLPSPRTITGTPVLR
jgi:hypothetical protein